MEFLLFVIIVPVGLCLGMILFGLFMVVIHSIFPDD